MHNRILVSLLRRLNACDDALAWLGDEIAAEYIKVAPGPALDAHQAFAALNQPDWLAWLSMRLRDYLPAEAVAGVHATLYAAAERARQHAAKALEAAGLADQAEALRELAPIADQSSARAAADEAWAAHEAEAVDGAAWAAEGAAWAAHEAVAHKAGAQEAAREAGAALEWAQEAAGPEVETERALQLSALRQALPLEVLERALEATTH